MTDGEASGESRAHVQALILESFGHIGDALRFMVPACGRVEAETERHLDASIASLELALDKARNARSGAQGLR